MTALNWPRAAAIYGHGAGLGALAWPTVPAAYVLNATVTHVHDGDSLDVGVSWGRRRYDLMQPIRLLGANAAELGTPGGDAAAANLQALLPPGTPVVLQTIADDKFAPRWDCAVTFLLNGTPTDLVGYLVAQNWLAVWDGRGTRPVPPWPRPVTA